MLIVVVLTIYGQTLRFGFVNYDDDVHVGANPMIKAGLTSKSLVWAWSTFYASNWHPLVWLSFLVDQSVALMLRLSEPAAVFHATNVLLHVGSTVLLYYLLLRLTGHPMVGFGVAGLFGLHPVHVESVAWVSERKDTLSVFWGLWTLHAYLSWTQSPTPRRWRWLHLAYLLSLLSKQMLVTLPAVLLLLDAWPLRRWRKTSPTTVGQDWQSLLREKWLLILLAGIFSVIVVAAQSDGESVGRLEDFSIGVRLANATIAYFDYLRSIVWPTKLVCFYPHPRENFDRQNLLVASLTLVSITLVAWVLRRRLPVVSLGWLWYLGTLLPVIGLVQVGLQARADRYLYFPAIGIYWAAADLLHRLGRRHDWLRKAEGVIVVAGLAVLAGLADRQTAVWRNTETLFTYALTIDDKVSLFHNNLAMYLLGNQQPERGRTHLQQAVESTTDWPTPLANLAELTLREGRSKDAIPMLRNVLLMNPRHLGAKNNLARALSDVGRLEEARIVTLDSLRQTPNNPPALNVLGMIEYRERNLPAAIEVFERAAQVNPDEPDAPANLALIYAANGQTDEARRWTQTALERALRQQNSALAQDIQRRLADLDRRR